MTKKRLLNSKGELRQELKLYMFAGKTVFSANSIEVLRKRLPNIVEIARRKTLLEGSGKDFEPFRIELNKEDTIAFCNKMSFRYKMAPLKFIYLNSNRPEEGKNIAVAEIILWDEPKPERKYFPDVFTSDVKIEGKDLGEIFRETLV